MAFESQLEFDERDIKTHESENNIISFTTKENEDEGFYELLLNRIPVRSAGQHKYIVGLTGLQILKSKGIKYKLINK